MFQLWTTLAVIIPQFGAMRISNEHRTRNNGHTTKRDDFKGHFNSLSQPDFPYRFVFPANHPFSSFTQFLSPPPAISPYGNDNTGYEFYPSGTSQQYLSSQPEYKYAVKSPPQSLTFQSNAQPPASNPLQVTPIPFQPGSTPMILLLHAGNPGSTGTIQTFMLIPADSNQQFGNLGATVSQQYGNLPMHPLNNFGLSHPNIVPIPTASLPPPMILRPSGYTKSSKSNYHNQLHTQLLQRPINLYQMPNAKYYPQKKNSIESKMSSDNANLSSVPGRSASTTTDRTSEKISLGKRGFGTESKNVR